MLAAISSAIIAFAPSLSVAVLGRFLNGISVATIPAAAAILALYFSKEKFAQAMGIMMAAGCVGNIITSKPMVMFNESFGWRVGMGAVTVWIALLCIALFFFIKDKKSSGENVVITPKKINFVGIFAGLGIVLRSKHFWYLAIWLIFACTVYFSLMTMWAMPYLMQSYGYAKGDAASIILWQAVLSLITIPLMGWFADSIKARKLIIVICSAIGLICCVVLMLCPGSLGTISLIVCILGIGTAATAGASCIFALIRINFPPQVIGVAVGCSNSIWSVIASGFSILFGVILSSRLEVFKEDSAVTELIMKADFGAANLKLYSSAYGSTFTVYVVLWLLALLCACFLIKEKFEVN